jgi:hypothetical protein
MCCFEHNKGLRRQTEAAWTDQLNTALENVLAIIEAPDEVSKEGHFLELLEEFCTNRQRGRNREDLLLGRAWENEDEGRHYFRLKGLQDFLTSKGIKEYTRPQLMQFIKSFGGECTEIKAGGRGVVVWWVPGSLFVNREPLALPESEDPTI